MVDFDDYTTLAELTGNLGHNQVDYQMTNFCMGQAMSAAGLTRQEFHAMQKNRQVALQWAKANVALLVDAARDQQYLV